MIRRILLILPILVFLASCGKDDDEDVISPKINKESIVGFVQKGPYINGTSITMFEINNSLSQTGKSFMTQITNDRGAFEINDIELSSSFVDLSANGYYFNEVKGDISSSQLNLRAITDIKDISSVNVNILTHLARRRLLFLVGEGKSFSEAKEISQNDVLSIFNIDRNSINPFERLDISQEGEDNAILLAISIILQGNRNGGELTELLAQISEDIEEDGVVDNTILIDQLRTQLLELNEQVVQTNLSKRYENLGISYSIPPFQKYIDNFLSFTSKKPTIISSKVDSIFPRSSIIEVIVNPNSASTDITIQYGTTDSLSNQIIYSENPVIGYEAVGVTVEIQDLNPVTQYYYRVKAENKNGVTIGETLDFMTPLNDIDSDGVADDVDQCPNTPEGETVNEYGCSISQIDSDGDGIMDDVDQCPDTPIGETLDEYGCSDSQKDTDGDGVMDNIDQDNSTRNGVPVDENGVMLNPIYLDENGVTIKCYEWGIFGDVGEIDGIKYTIVSKEELKTMINEGKYSPNICTSKITNLYEMFVYSHFNLDISNWDVSHVTNMYQMFLYSKFNQDISNWDVSNVTDMQAMFMGSDFNQDVSSWDVSKVTNMYKMFQISQFNQDISNWNVSKVTNMSHMFKDSQFNQDISNWNVGQVTNMSQMFLSSQFNQDISNWDVRNVTDMYQMFRESQFNQDISNWNVSNVTDMYQMFWNSQFNQDISNWDVSKVFGCGEFCNPSVFTEPKPNFIQCDCNCN